MQYLLNSLLNDINISGQNPNLGPARCHSFRLFYSTFLDWSLRLEDSLIQNKVQVILTLLLPWLQLSKHWLSSSKPLVHSYMPSKTGEGGSHTTGTQLPCSQIPPSRHWIFRDLLIRQNKRVHHNPQGGYGRSLDPQQHGTGISQQTGAVGTCQPSVLPLHPNF